MKSTFAERLKQERSRRRYTQQQLASITQISVQTIRNYEQGVCEPISLYLLELAKALDVTPEFLLIGDNNMNSYSAAIKTELMQLNDFKSISEIKDSELNSTILSHLEMSEELVSDITEDWNGKSIFKRTKIFDEKSTEVYSYCTRKYVQDVILKYCQNRSIYKEKFKIQDGMILNSEKA